MKHKKLKLFSAVLLSASLMLTPFDSILKLKAEEVTEGTEVTVPGGELTDTTVPEPTIGSGETNPGSPEPSQATVSSDTGETEADSEPTDVEGENEPDAEGEEKPAEENTESEDGIENTEDPSQEDAKEPVTFKAETDEITAVVIAEADTLPDGAQLNVSKIEEGSAQYVEVEKALDLDETKTFTAFDLHFLHEGEEVQPKEGKKVSVNLTLKKTLLPEEAEAPTAIVHLNDETGTLTPVVVAGPDAAGEIRTQGDKVETVFETDGFSPYAMVANKAAKNGSTYALFDREATFRIPANLSSGQFPDETGWSTCKPSVGIINSPVLTTIAGLFDINTPWIPITTNSVNNQGVVSATVKTPALQIPLSLTITPPQLGTLSNPNDPDHEYVYSPNGSSESEYYYTVNWTRLRHNNKSWTVDGFVDFHAPDFVTYSFKVQMVSNGPFEEVMTESVKVGDIKTPDSFRKYIDNESLEQYFDGWYSNQECNVPMPGKWTVSEPMTFYGRYIKNQLTTVTFSKFVDSYDTNDKNKSYKFTVELSATGLNSENISVVTSSGELPKDKLVFDKNKKVSFDVDLKGGESLQIKTHKELTVPGATINFKEDIQGTSDFTTTYSYTGLNTGPIQSKDSGDIPFTGDLSVTCTNTKELPVPAGLKDSGSSIWLYILCAGGAVIVATIAGNYIKRRKMEV